MNTLKFIDEVNKVRFNGIRKDIIIKEILLNQFNNKIDYNNIRSKESNYSLHNPTCSLISHTKK